MHPINIKWHRILHITHFYNSIYHCRCVKSVALSNHMQVTGSPHVPFVYQMFSCHWCDMSDSQNRLCLWKGAECGASDSCPISWTAVIYSLPRKGQEAQETLQREKINTGHSLCSLKAGSTGYDGMTIKRPKTSLEIRFKKKCNTLKKLNIFLRTGPPSMSSLHM